MLPAKPIQKALLKVLFIFELNLGQYLKPWIIRIGESSVTFFFLET